MERLKRKPFQGVINIIRFNWHFYVIAFAIIISAFLFTPYITGLLKLLVIAGLSLAVLSIIISLWVSWYVYDHTNLYTLNWLDDLVATDSTVIANINAGFDETSAMLQHKFPGASLIVLDFYDPLRHTEISIKRARKVYPPYPGTKTIRTEDTSLSKNSVDQALMIFAAHEIRDMKERINFFCQVGESLHKDGKIIVVEHLRDLNNFIAYNIGFLHFHSYRTWKYTFENAWLKIEKEIKLNPFVSAFVLSKA